MTLTEKLLSAAAGKEVKAGDLVTVPLDLVMANDITGILAVKLLEKYGLKPGVPEKTVFVLDHFTPNKDILSAENCRVIREYCKKYGIRCLEGAEGGIEHALLPEIGAVTAGDLVIGAASHTCTYGAVGAFSTGVGSTDMAAAAVSGKTWLKVPEAVKVELSGRLPEYTSGKDVVLSLIGEIGVDGAAYRSLEFTGEGAATLSMEDRFTICNMAIEAGAKNGVFEADGKTLEYLKSHGAKEPKVFKADKDADYSGTVKINLGEVVPTVACPSLPSNVRAARELKDVKIDQVVIGSCTNGRLGDLHRAAAVLKGKKVAAGVRAIVIPATQRIYKEALADGTLSTFAESGFIVSAPSCGPCLGGHLGILAEGERCVSTTNRNFVGRMGHVKSEVYLASPETAAASALAGYICDPSEVLK